MRFFLSFLLPALLLCFFRGHTQPAARFRVLVLYENGGHHIAFSRAARPWLDSLAVDSNFSITYLNSLSTLDGAFLDSFQLFLQLDYVPYGWPATAAAAFRAWIEKGRGGWVGLHHATLLGEFDGFPMWNWFSGFMGGIRYKEYIPDFASGEVSVENPAHPVMKGVPAKFLIRREEWYTYDRSPRPRVQVLASVDEKSYVPDTKVKMGDHPVVWSNPAVPARNVYIFMGHGPDLLLNPAYRRLLQNAIFWAASR